MAYVKYYIKQLGEPALLSGSWNYLWKTKRTKEGKTICRRYYRTWCDAQEALATIFHSYADIYVKLKWQCYVEWEKDLFLIDKTVFVIRSEKHYGGESL